MPLKYSFKQRNNARPFYDISDDMFMLSEFHSFTFEYIEQIVSSLKQVQDGILEAYNFWWDVTWVFVEKWKSTARVAYDQYDSVTNTYLEKELEIPIEDIYNLMKDWKEYIEKWENETWKTSH